jgi:hypothetical protein
MTAAEVMSLAMPYQGGIGKLWQYKVSHDELVILLQKKHVKARCVIVCNGCREVACQVVWRVGELQVTEDKSTSLLTTYLEDKSAGLRICCARISAIQSTDDIPVDWLETR